MFSSHTARIGVITEDGIVFSVFCRADGQPEALGETLLKHYGRRMDAQLLVALGALGYVRPLIEPPPGRPHRFMRPAPDVTLSYARDGGYPMKIAKHADVLALLDDASCHEDFLYVYGTFANIEQWRAYDTRRGLKPLGPLAGEAEPTEAAQEAATIAIGKAMLTSLGNQKGEAEPKLLVYVVGMIAAAFLAIAVGQIGFALAKWAGW